MIADLKPYPAMKDSGVPWLGEVPAHWKVRRLKYLLRERDVRSVKGSEQLLRVSQYTGVTERRADDTDGERDTRAESLVGYKLVSPNELVVNIMLAWNGSMGVSVFSGIASPAYCVYRFVKQAEPWYFHYLLRSPLYKARIKAMSTGVVESRLRLYTDDLYRLEAILPPCSEQAAIARFLDHADRRIRRYIRAKQKLIKLLEEQKQAVIYHAVTRGLETAVRLKPSGVEWLGNVPAHWESSRLKAVLLRPTRNGIFKKKDSFGSGAPLVNVADVYREDFRVATELLDRVRATPDEVETFRVQPGDLFFVRSSLKLEGTGRSAVVLSCEPDTVFECHLVQARPNQARVSARFLATQLNSFGVRHYLISRANVVTMATIAQDVIATCPLWLPALSEQAVILGEIDEAAADLDHTTKAAQFEIRLLREYRTRLIADAVTGKIDVREAAARLPDGVEEPEPLDEVEAEGGAGDARAADADEVREEAEA